jgi:hypothetical protein
MLRFRLSAGTPLLAAFCALTVGGAPAVHAQVFTVEAEHVEKHYTEFAPTHVRYSEQPINQLGREVLIRFMQSEQGFAMRPLPIANLELHANGHMDPTGDKYVDLLHQKGVSARPGDRVVVTDIKIGEKTIQLDLNGGFQHKHRILRHISIGMDPVNSVPLASDDGVQPTGSRVTLVFEERVPDLNGEQLEALLKPMIDFGVKSPAEAYAETLPPFLRNAIEQHRVLVGMNRDMLIYAKGQPVRKMREEGADGKQYEIWIYGETPQPVEFVRLEGNFVIRVELARVGEPIVVHAQNEMGDYWGQQPAMASNVHEIKLGDEGQVERTEESAPPQAPTLRKPGETLPQDSDKDNPAAAMRPVNMPPDLQRPGDPGYHPTVSAQPGQGNGTGQAGANGSGSSQTKGTQNGSASDSQSTQAQPQTKPADNPPQGTNPLDQPHR